MLFEPTERRKTAVNSWLARGLLCAAKTKKASQD